MVNTVEEFGAKNNSSQGRFVLAAGTAGIDAATNIVVKAANRQMLYWVYAAVVVLCFITFRSVLGVLVAVLPLMLTSILCEALMVKLGMGVKVATLPVIALGVGIGVDYALYMLSVMLGHLRDGKSLSQAYYATLCFTGRIVILTGLTFAFGVATWAFSPIKFQADIGVLLVFMFVWNMLGAMILLPSLACFLLPQKKNEEANTDPVATVAVSVTDGAKREPVLARIAAIARGDAVAVRCFWRGWACRRWNQPAGDGLGFAAAPPLTTAGGYVYR